MLNPCSLPCRSSALVLIFLILTSGLTLPASADIPKGPILFQDDFSEGTGKWIRGDKGRVQDNWFYLRGASGVLHRVVAKGGDDWTDYVVEFDVKIIDIIASWMVRCDQGTNPSRYYLFCFNGRALQRNVRLDKNQPAGEIVLPTPVRHGTPCRVTIVAQGSVIKHYINGQLIDTFTDDSISTGGFGFRQLNSERGSFANVKIYAAPQSIERVGEASRWQGRHAMASIPFIATPPHVDGQLAKDEWAHAARLAGFSDLEGRLARKQTTVFAQWDDEHLYLAFESTKKFDHNLTKKARDSSDIFNTDAVEISLHPDGTTWAKLAFDHVGSQWDAQLKGKTTLNQDWNPDWTVRSHIINDEFYVIDTWQAEVKIPFASLQVDTPTPGDRWGVQFCRDFDDVSNLGYPTTQRWTSWSPATEGGFNEPTTFGIFRFVKQDPVFRLNAYQDIYNGFAGIAGTLQAGGKADFSLALRAWSTDQAHEPLVSKQVAYTDNDGVESISITAQEPLDVPEITDVVVHWQIKDKANATTVALGAVKSQCVPSFALIYAPLFSQKKLVIEGDLSRIPSLPPETRITIEIRDLAGTILSKSQETITTDSFLVRHSLETVPAGRHAITAILTAPDGRVVATSARPFEVPPDPEWAAQKTGVLANVPAPWTPVTIENQKGAITVNTWAKAYQYEETMFPSQISIRGEDRLAAPVRFVIVTDRGPENIRVTSPKIQDTSDLGTTLRWQGQGDLLDVENEARIEFDGLIWNKTLIRPREGAVTIREAYLEIPLRKNKLRYMRGEDSMNFLKSHSYIAMIAEGKLDHDFPLPDENPNFSVKGWPWQDRFVNFYWAGGVDFGLFAILPSLRNTSISKQYNDLVEEPDRCMLRIYFIDRPTQISDSTHYAYGLMGTPTRPMRNRSQMNRTGYHGIYKLDWDYLMHEISREWKGAVIDKFFTGPKIAVQASDFYAKTIQGGIRVNLGNPFPDNKALNAIRLGVEQCRNLGMKPLLWLDLTYTPITLPHEKPYAYEWEQYPKQRHVYGGEQCTLVCPKVSSWADYYLAGLDKLMKERGVEGVYLDMTGPGACHNHYHDCGHVSDGQRQGEIPFLELRDLFLRLYNVVHRNDPDGIIFYHSNSWNPTVLYADMNTKGEGWSPADDYRTFSLPYYQAGYMFQHQYNIAHNFFATHIYCSYRGKPERVASLDECVGMALLHDTLPCASSSLEIAGLLNTWNALDDFGVYEKDTVWVPYWESGLGDWVNGVAASHYRRTGQHFLVLFNTDFDKESSIALGPDKIVFRQVHDIIEGTATQSSRLDLTLAPRALKLLWLR